MIHICTQIHIQLYALICKGFPPFLHFLFLSQGSSMLYHKEESNSINKISASGDTLIYIKTSVSYMS